MRIIFNFAAKCTLKCEWCYIDFGRRAPTLEESSAVIRRCRELGATWITIGGGDPSAMSFLPDLLRNANTIGLHIHLDTNGIGLSKLLTAEVASWIDLLGLPLDGPAAIHDLTRSHPGHFKVVMDARRVVAEAGIPLKLNTMLCNVNALYIDEIAAVVRDIEPLAWSIYRYWPLAAGGAVAKQYELDEMTYRNVTANIATKVPTHTRVEIADSAERSGRTLLVTHDGILHSQSTIDSNQYTYFGSIFDDRIVEMALASVAGECEQVLERYSSTQRNEPRPRT